MINLAFDGIWIPTGISALAGAWFLWWTLSPGTWSAGWFYFPAYLMFGVALPAFPALVAWLIWALAT